MTPDATISPFFQHEAYAVLGVGRSGLAAARLLSSRGKRVRLIDEAADPAREDLRPLVERGVELRFGSTTDEAAAAAALTGCQAAVVSPGFAWNHPLLEAARRLGLPLLSELELGWLCRGGARVVGITGTNGKTTVTMLVEQILRDAGKRAVAAGNIGYALSDAVREAGDQLDETTFAVEVSSFQLETIERFAPEVAVVLNVTADHLDRHASMEEYARTKQRLTDGQGPDGVLVVNQDDPTCLAIAQRTRARVRRFSLNRPVEDGAWLDGDLIQLIQPGERPRRLLAMDELKMIGLHNVANAMAAACACQALGVNHPRIAETLRAFQAAPHRLQPAGEIGGALYVNDSKATNLDAMLQAIDSFEGGLLLIAGGRDKNSPFGLVASRLARRVKEVFLIGEAARLMELAWGGTVTCRQCGTLERALEEAGARAEAGDVVLLSPGCASFDQFHSYAHRGEVFMEWVRRRIESDPGKHQAE
jgi:UDP-N-acetylmuramoylalanine--D-glutamate ligase